MTVCPTVRVVFATVRATFRVGRIDSIFKSQFKMDMAGSRSQFSPGYAI